MVGSGQLDLRDIRRLFPPSLMLLPRDFFRSIGTFGDALLPAAVAVPVDGDGVPA
jgi:hypothetical protein